MPVAPAAPAARTTAASCSGRSESPGRIGAIPTLVSIPASTSVVSARSRWCGGAVPGSVVRQTSRSSVGTENVTVTWARRAASARTSTSRTISGPRVMSENGLRRPAERLEASSRQPVAALGRLVGIGCRADHDLLAAPRRPCELAREYVGDVDLDPDRTAVAVVGGPVGPELERAHVTERAAVHAAGVGVQRPPERHPLDAVEGGAAGSSRYSARMPRL